MKMDYSKRDTFNIAAKYLLFSKLFSLGFFSSSVYAETWKKDWFLTKSVEKTLDIMGVKKHSNSKNISLSAPDTAENGAYVGVGVRSTIKGIDMIAVLVEKNPNILAGYFNFGTSVYPDLSTKIKMAESSKIHALVKTVDDSYYLASKSVNVVLGGCGN